MTRFSHMDYRAAYEQAKDESDRAVALGRWIEASHNNLKEAIDSRAEETRSALSSFADRFDRLEARLEDRFKRFEERFERFEDRFDRFDDKLDKSNEAVLGVHKMAVRTLCWFIGILATLGSVRLFFGDAILALAS